MKEEVWKTPPVSEDLCKTDQWFSWRPHSLERKKAISNAALQKLTLHEHEFQQFALVLFFSYCQKLT